MLSFHGGNLTLFNLLMKQTFDFVRKTNATAHLAREKVYKDKTLPKFQKGDLVYVFNPALNAKKGRKFAGGYEGPYQIISQVNDVVYELISFGSWKEKPVKMSTSIDRIKSFSSYVDSFPKAKEIDNNLVFVNKEVKIPPSTPIPVKLQIGRAHV